MKNNKKLLQKVSEHVGTKNLKKIDEHFKRDEKVEKALGLSEPVKKKLSEKLRRK